jgi:glucose/arabinose dehydrogenase/regulation of enolase protein 1 (concanavalin A-like superfamily)
MKHLKTTCLVSIRLFLAVFSFGLASGPGNAATLPSGFIETRLAFNLAQPSAMALAPDGRLFFLESKNGAVRIIKNGALLPTPFVTLAVDSFNERGLLGITFDPNFASNQYVYLYYTAMSPEVTATHNRVVRYTASGDVALAGSKTVILDLDNLSTAGNHNGGALHFGLDGKLYIAVGNNANNSAAQQLTNRLGKILRINADGTIPSDNPTSFQAVSGTTSGANRAIWAIGLRNPFTFAIQPATGRLFINDVGQNDWEEINDGVAGLNYGWTGLGSDGSVNCSTYTCPLYTYAHGSGTTMGYAITGGDFYDPSTAQFPGSYTSDYFFADYVNGWINVRDSAAGTVSNFATGIARPVDLRVAPDGSLYYLSYGNTDQTEVSSTGSIFKVQYTGSQAPWISIQPQSQTAGVGRPVTFSLSASGATPRTYQWRRNGANISGATSSSYTIASVQASDNGASFSCLVSNSFGSLLSNNAVLTVSSNQLPSATVTAPANGMLYSAGDTISYSGSGTDPEDGTLAASRLSWTINFHHDTHVHPFLGPINGVGSGSFTIPRTGELATNVWYRILLTATDSAGASDTKYVDILPRKANITLATNPAGLQVSLDGQAFTAPATIESVVGMTRSLSAPSPQPLGGTTYQFASWSDGGASTHNVNAPATNTTYTANFTPVALPSPWLNGDIGSVGAAGSASHASGVFTVKGSGTQIANASDSFQYLYQPATGDCSITARVASVQNVDSWSKAGVMIRESLAADSKFAFALVTPGAGLAYEVRTATGGAHSYVSSGISGAAPNWVRVTRVGDTFTGYRSTDGATWTSFGSATIPMGSSVYIGLPVCSRNNTTLCTATFDNVTADPGAAPASITSTDYQFGTSTATYASTDSDAGSAAGSMSFGAGFTTGGISTTSGNPPNCLFIKAANNSTEALAISGNKYITCTVTPGSALSFKSITFDYTRDAAAAATGYSVRSSADNYAATIGSGTLAGSNAWTAASIDLSTVAALQNTGTAKTFRIYFWGGTDTTTVTRFDNIQVKTQ